MPPLAPTREQLVLELAQLTVALVDAERDHVYCSGVWISETEILTAAHCVDHKDIGDGVQYSILGDVVDLPQDQVINPRPAVVEDVDSAHDLALIQATLFVPNHPVAEVSRSSIHAGVRVLAMGNPRGMVWSFSSGDVAAIRWFNDGDSAMWYVQATVPISPGSSGCGLYDERGRLVGIAREYIVGAQNLNLFVHRDYVLRFLEPS